MARTKSSLFSTDNIRRKLEALDVVGRKKKLLEWYHAYGAGFGNERAARLTRTLGRTGGIVTMLIFTSAAMCFVIGSFMAGAPLIIQLVPGAFALIGIMTLVGLFKQPTTNAAKSENSGSAPAKKHRRSKSAKS